MYEYIKGKKVQLEEHMLSATEIASLFGILQKKQNGEFKPYAIMVSSILEEFNTIKNLNMSEFFYPYSHGCMRVYPEALWRPALENFVYKNDLGKHPKEELYYKMSIKNKSYNYYYREPTKGKVVSYNNIRRIKNGN